MAARKRGAQIGALIAEVEALARRLRKTIRAQAAAMPKDIRQLAAQLRKQAAKGAAQVEKYVHELRKELEAPVRTAVKRRGVRGRKMA
jgi:hypothetical protein